MRGYNNHLPCKTYSEDHCLSVILAFNNMRVDSRKPAFEKVSPVFGSSILVKQFDESRIPKQPFWHFHPELELVYINGGSGKRHIGNHVSYFSDGDLMLIGSNLPHFGFTDSLTGNKSETLIQMKPEMLDDAFLKLPELSNIAGLIKKAQKGITFFGETKEWVGAEMEKMIALNTFDRFMKLLEILNILTHSREYKVLNVGGIIVETMVNDHHRMNDIYIYLRKNFQRNIPISEVADIISMTEPSFCRYFKKMTGKTWTQFVNEFRLVHASKLLAETGDSITNVCFESGYNNFSHFNKQFKKFTGKNPSDYRKALKSIIE